MSYQQKYHVVIETQENIDRKRREDNKAILWLLKNWVFPTLKWALIFLPFLLIYANIKVYPSIWTFWVMIIIYQLLKIFRYIKSRK